MLSQQTRRVGKRAPRRLEARVEARARNRAPQTARPEHGVLHRHSRDTNRKK